MRTAEHMNQYRYNGNPLFQSAPADGLNGVFWIPLDRERRCHALCISSTGNKEIRWEHVSVRVIEKHNAKLIERVPNWPEMAVIKDMFWKDDECVVQYHPRREDYINHHHCVLHLWRPLDVPIPMPPKECV